MKKKNILFLYGSYGSGHKTISDYIKTEFEKYPQKYNILSIDIVEYASLGAKIYSKLFNLNVKIRSKFIFGLLYEISNHKLITTPYKKIAISSFKSKKLKSIIKDFDPDLTISTLFFSSTLIGNYNKYGITNSKLITVITDYYVHELWTKNYDVEDAIIVSNDMIKEHLINKGIPANKIMPYGMPITEKIKEMLEPIEKVKQRYGINNNNKTILFFGGGSMGSMSYFEYFRSVCKLNLNVNLIFIAGNNNNLKRRCEEYVQRKKCKYVHVLGFTSDVINLLNISELVITKSGGATITECIEMKKPMIIIPGYGGQETYNAKYVKKKGFGIVVKSIFGLTRNLKTVLFFPITLKIIKNKLEKNSKNESVEKIFKLSNELLKEEH